VNAYLLIDAVVQQTMVFIAQLATAGGVRAPLAHVANQVFLDLTSELQSRGVKKKVIADMFGMALRTYHRRVRELGESRTDAGKTVWEAVLGFIREREPVSGSDVLRRFGGDDPEVVLGVLADLSQTGLVYRAGRGDTARYRIADESDFADDEQTRSAAHEHLVWLAVYRTGPATEAALREATHLGDAACAAALEALVRDGRVASTRRGGSTTYSAERFEVPLGAPTGWEAAVLDHFQAMVGAITAKLSCGTVQGAPRDAIGGSTWSLDVWPGHPLETDAKGLLATVRRDVEALRARIDAHNAAEAGPPARERVVFYAGQNLCDATTSPQGDQS
jgi:hypothetical protein